ncbi:MAG: hypothetical protein IJ842_04960 [Bacilli bacterium]|nr:hypothetical protein [Bacilli bacterium]
MKKIVRKRQLLNNKLVLNIILVLFMFLTIGYSTLSTNLNINGNLNIKKYYEPTLYNVLAKEAETGGLAKKYNGEHHDSFTEDPSKDIYHWYAANDTQGTQILDKNNVIFAGHCWQMIRTTDTGGVKMIYNGEAENNQCLNTRGNHVGYASRTSQNLASNYWYGTDYTYYSANKTFKVSGTTEEATWNASTGPGLVGKYTCKNTSVDGTCETLYLVESYNNTSNAFVLPLNSNSHYSEFGRVQYNVSKNSPTFVGYMYGDVYSYGSTNSIIKLNISSTETLLYTKSLSTSYWYADSIEYKNTSERYYNYILKDPFKVSSTNDYNNLTGKYTLFNSSETSLNPNNGYYIAGVSGSTAYYKSLGGGNTLISSYEPLLFGDSIIDNGDGSYTLSNVTSVTYSDWVSNYSIYKNKYTCGTNNTTCSNLRYTIATTSKDYTYINAGEKIMIGKTRNGLTLTDTILVRTDEWFNNYSSYSDYKYTCNTDSATCTEATLRLIIGYTATGYNYAPNHYYGSSVTWDGTNYTLVDPIGIENYNNLNNLSTHHYMCVSNGLKTCSTVAYVFYYTGTGAMSYIALKDGVTSVDKVLEDMFTKNTTNSTVKSGVDAWYKHTLLSYDEYIEDTIFCNDRSISSLGGWNPNGGMTNENLQFKEYDVTSDISCTNRADQFSVSNNSAKLTYKVGLMTVPEMNILNNPNARKTGQYFLLATAYYTSSVNSYVRGIRAVGTMLYSQVVDPNGVRPSISLIPEIEYSSGDGSMANPYIVDTGGN